MMKNAVTRSHSLSLSAARLTHRHVERLASFTYRSSPSTVKCFSPSILCATRFVQTLPRSHFSSSSSSFHVNQPFSISPFKIAPAYSSSRFTTTRCFSTSPQQPQQQQQQPAKNEPDYEPSRDQGTDYMLSHPIWKGILNNVQVTFRPTQSRLDRMAWWTIQAIRFNFDWMSGYSFGRLTRNKCISRILFLESIAGIPGAIGGVLRHLASLRNMKRDHGWIHTLYEEAENERMHLLIATHMKQPSLFFRAAVFVSQGIFYNFFFAAYIVSPHFCHRLVGYLEEQAVVTYQHIIDGIDSGTLAEWGRSPAPELAVKYWSMPADATVRDMILRFRADEAHHRDVNHTFGDLPLDAENPFKAGH